MTVGANRFPQPPALSDKLPTPSFSPLYIANSMDARFASRDSGVSVSNTWPKGETVRSTALSFSLLSVLGFGMLSGCSTENKSPDVSGQIRSSLNQAGLKDVSVSQDREKGVVTLKGSTTSDSDKAQAESIAKSIAPSQVVANEIAVRPTGEETTARKVEADIDKGIENNFDAVLVSAKLDNDVKYDVKNGVITLTGRVNSQSQRKAVQHLAEGVPNVKQVVNELKVKSQKASS